MYMTNDKFFRNYFNIFSNWILIWTILYFSNLVNVPSPFYSIVIAIVMNIIFSLRILYFNKNIIHFIIFWVVVSTAKVIPAYIIGLPNNYDGLLFGIGLFLVYSFYIIYNLGWRKLIEIVFSTKLKYGPGVQSVINYLNI
mgnify:CR=1 FL=1